MPVDPDKIIRDHAREMAREIDRQVIENLIKQKNTDLPSLAGSKRPA